MDKKLAVQKMNVNKFMNFCEAVLNTDEAIVTKGYIEAKSKVITEMWAKLDLANDTLLLEITEDEKSSSVYFGKGEFDKAFVCYDAVMLKMENMKAKFNVPVNPKVPAIQLPENMTLNAVNTKSVIKLKPIDIPTFSGDYKKWISFKSMFDSLVHENEEFTPLQKIHYLKSCLSGEAGRMVSQFDITSESYTPAYEIITERFHNEVILVDTHIICILSQPNLTVEDSNCIKELMDVTTENIRALKSLKIETDTWDPILLLLLVQKLDPSTRRLWEQNLKPKVRPTMKEFLEFLSTRFHALGCQQNFRFSIEATSNNNQYQNNRRSISNGSRCSGSANHKSNYQDQQFPPTVHQGFHVSTTTQRKCPLQCGGFHYATDCERLAKANISTRIDLVNCARLCNNCLKGHSGKCSRSAGCVICNKYHHTLLHTDTSSNVQYNPTKEPTSTSVHIQQTENTSSNEPSRTITSAHVQQAGNSSTNIVRRSGDTTERITWDEPVLLSTAIVLVRSSRDKSFYPFRALLDQASEASYISEYASQFLGLTKKNVFATTTGLGGTKTGEIKYVADFELGSKQNPSFHLKVQAPVLPKVTNPLPSTRLQKHDWSHIHGLQLADPEFATPGKIDILLGAPVYGYLLLPGLIKKSPELPVAQNTEFGWILSGPTRDEITSHHSISCFHLRIDIDDQLKKFFDKEEVSKKRVMTQEEIECENFFKRTHRRNEEGRFIVSLPFKSDPKLLGSSKGQAISRLMKLESKLSACSRLEREYKEILKEYEDLDHTTVLGELVQENETTSYYLPHHAVFKPDSTTTKTRIVFDASAKSVTGISLNDILMTGPKLQQDLASLLLRWRIYFVVFAADIAKMYRQVLITEEDRKYQKFLFRENKNEAIKEHQHNMVTFGVTSATYLAVKALQQLAEDERDKFPEAAEIVLRDFYMDDGMSGADCVEEGIKLCKELKELLANGKFELRKFISNSAELLESIPEVDRELKLPLEININENIKTLGIRYEPSTDEFQFKVNLQVSQEWPTKKSLLSESSKLFDPLGWLAPVVIRAKIMFQKLWQEGLAWDQKLPENIAKEWLEFRSELCQLEKIKIIRWIGKRKTTKLFELHGFSDASEAAYSAVIYARVVNEDSSIQITMLTSKTRVAPINQLPLPKLELCGAVLLANLMSNVQEALSLDNKDTHVWTDLTVVLGWLRTSPSKLKTFVANRVVEVQNFLNVNQWHHIEGKNNPADCASRGINPSELENHELWWNGPDCLREPRSSWEQNLTIPPVILELKKNKLATFVTAPHQGLEEFLNRYSSFNRLVRITAISLRFIDNLRQTTVVRISNIGLGVVNKLKSQKNKLSGLVITVNELERARKHLILLKQKTDFAREIYNLRNKKPVHKKSKIAAINPFLDSEGILRVGGRLKNADIPYNRKHPIILAASTMTKLIITDAHLKTLHGGTGLTMNVIRENFWIIGLRNQVKNNNLRCVRCFRFRKSTGQQIMADLPVPRVNLTIAFTHTGVDFAGPFKIKASNIKSPPLRIKPVIVNGEVIKAIPKVPVYEGYVVVFVCLSTKAIHLEAVSDQTTDAFLAALTRFTARNNTPEHMYTDNGATFIGAKNVLAIEKEKSIVDYAKVAKFLVNEQITWHFIPPRAPHFGGMWEAGVKSMKHHLKRIVGETVLTFEEITTVLARIESCLNSRPLCPLTDDPNDLEALTLAHFLVRKTMVAPPTGKSITPKRGPFRERWRIQEKLQKDFWKSWSEEYLSRLQQRPKWLMQQDNFKVGDMVLLKEDDLPPLKWPLARITEVYPSEDENVRSVKIKTAAGEYVRPIVKLCSLPIKDNENSVKVN